MAIFPTPQPQRKPSWLKVKLPIHENFFNVSSWVKSHHLNTICQSARCPNISECWSKKTATFLILGDVCTRRCTFCAVEKGIPSPPSKEEAARIADFVTVLGLHYTVITSVTRDDLSDGGATLFVETMQAIRKIKPDTRIEVLIPDFAGNEKSLEMVVKAEPDVLNHNLEVPESLYPAIGRPKENYRRSLGVLSQAKKMGVITKSGLMIGLGESEIQIMQTLKDLRQTGCDLLTIGQYLQATKSNAAVAKYYTLPEFVRLKEKALTFGFQEVEAGPLVRSSYRAQDLYKKVQYKGKKKNALPDFH